MMVVNLRDLPYGVNPDKSEFFFSYKQVINNLYNIVFINLNGH